MAFSSGDIPLKADPLQLDDSKWELVNLPHTVQLVPSEASGSRNYQGPAWYSKRFTVDTRYQGKRLSLYFEAVMGKAALYQWLQGKGALRWFSPGEYRFDCCWCASR